MPMSMSMSRPRPLGDMVPYNQNVWLGGQHVPWINHYLIYTQTISIIQLFLEKKCSDWSDLYSCTYNPDNIVICQHKHTQKGLVSLSDTFSLHRTSININSACPAFNMDFVELLRHFRISMVNQRVYKR
jgi:hypothetical protein